jgi:hypothetical protein
MPCRCPQKRCDYESLMKDIAIGDGWGFQNNFEPQQARRGYSIKSYAPHYALTPTAELLHELRASESGYCSWKNSGSFGK